MDLGAQGLAETRRLSRSCVKVSSSHPQLPLGLALRESARFDSYYPGNNHEAVQAARGCATGDGEQLVYLAAPAGCGKTHLLQAACVTAAAAGRSVVYLPLASAGQLSPLMLDGLEQQDLVCLDDVDMIAGHPEWEQALFGLFNRLREAGRTLLVAASKRADRCGFGLPDLVSRLGWGVTYVLAPLLDAQVVDALALRARGRGLELPDDTAQYLVRRLPRDLPTVFALLDRLDQVSMIEQRRLTIPFVKSVLDQA
jgi:DnaA family protein